MKQPTNKQYVILTAIALLLFVVYSKKDEITTGVNTIMEKLSLRDFVNKFKAAALNIQSKYGVPYEVILAQAILESNYGKSAPQNNFFGIKDTNAVPGSQLLNTTEWNPKTKTYDKIKLAFEVYATPEQAFEEHAKLLKRVYSFAFAYNGDPKKFAEQLTIKSYPKYATDPGYTSKLNKLIDSIRSV